MKVAFAILAHKNWKQLSLLVSQLKAEWNEVFVHIDKKAHFCESQFVRDNPGLDCVFVSPRVPVYWGHSSQIDATVALFRSIASFGESFDRVILLSGQDFPIVSNQMIVEFFAENREKEFLEFGRLPLWNAPIFDPAVMRVRFG